MSPASKFLFLALALILESSALGSPLDRTATVLKFEEIAHQGQFPYHVSLHSTRNPIGHMCSGAILSERWILTSALCSELSPDPSVYSVVAGDIDLKAGQVYEVEKMVYFPKFNVSSPLDNVALWRTKTDIIFSDRVQAIKCAMKPVELHGGETVTVTGWGSMYHTAISQLLQHQEARVLRRKECMEFYTKEELPVHHLCLKRKQGQCVGDLGSPLVIDGVLFGMADQADNCNSVDIPERINELFFFQNWLVKTMEGTL